LSILAQVLIFPKVDSLEWREGNLVKDRHVCVGRENGEFSGSRMLSWVMASLVRATAVTFLRGRSRMMVVLELLSMDRVLSGSCVFDKVLERGEAETRSPREQMRFERYRVDDVCCFNVTFFCVAVLFFAAPNSHARSREKRASGGCGREVISWRDVEILVSNILYCVLCTNIYSIYIK
jgi:hypothetical protein